MEERQSRKGCRKTFRYKNPSYSVFDSGDYDRYMEYHDKAVVMVRGKEKAIRNRKSLDAFRKDLIKKGRERTTAYINQNIDTLHVRLSKQKTLGQVIPAELSDSIEAGIDKAFPASPVKMAFLLYYRAIYEIYNGFRNKAIEDLNKVIEICSRHPKHPGVNELLKSSSQLLKALAGEVSVEVTYENITSMWHNKGTRQTSSEFSKRLPVIHVTSAGSLRVFVQPSIYLDRVRTAGIRNTIVPLGIASQYRLRGPMNRFEDAKQWLLNR